MATKGVKHKSEEKTIRGITFVKGVNVGYDVSVGNLKITNVGFRSLRDVTRQLIAKGYKKADIRVKRSERKRVKV